MPKYTGDLAKPISHPAIGLLMSEDKVTAVTRSVVDERWRRMGLLFDAYGIEHGNWIALSFALAEAHVPGCRVTSAKSGPKTKWDEITRAELWLAVESLGDMSITDATKYLASLEPWKSLLSHTRGAATLRDEYNRADLRWVNCLREAKSFRALPD
jgi:hypothetical protein